MSVNQYQLDEVAALLAAQQEHNPEFFEKHMRAAFRDGVLRFWYPDGTPRICEPARPDDAFGDEYYLGLSLEYTTAEAVNHWLEHWGAKYRLKAEATAPARQKGLGEQQRALILQTIRELEHDPLALPRREAGKEWVKAQVWRQLEGHELFRSTRSGDVSEDIFDDAWKKLRAQGRRKDGPPKGIRERE